MPTKQTRRAGDFTARRDLSFAEVVNEASAVMANTTLKLFGK